MERKYMSTESPEECIGTTYPSKTYKRLTGCENLYVTIVFTIDKERKNKIEFLRVIGSGDNECGAAMYEAIADQTTFALRRARNEWELRQIIKNLRHHRCNKFSVGRAKSCADAIGEIIEKEIFPKEKEVAKN
jgi:hypothetical protein